MHSGKDRYVVLRRRCAESCSKELYVERTLRTTAGVVGRWLPGVADIRPGSGRRSSLGLGEESGGAFQFNRTLKRFFW